METWKDIKGYKDIYQVSNMGRVKSICRITNCNNSKIVRKERILKPCKTKHYLNIYLYNKQGERKSILLHRLVALYFVDNKDRLNEIDHIDGNSLNNHADNLRWVTHKDNCNNPITKSRYKGRISAKQKPVKCFSLDGEFIEEFDNITIAAYKTKSHRENISKCYKGIYNKTNNLIFKYS